MSKQPDSQLPTPKKTGPANYLEQTFASDEALRSHYLELLQKKMQKKAKSAVGPPTPSVRQKEKALIADSAQSPDSSATETDSADQAGGSSRCTDDTKASRPEPDAPKAIGKEGQLKATSSKLSQASETKHPHKPARSGIKTAHLLIILAATLLPWIFLYGILNFDELDLNVVGNELGITHSTPPNPTVQELRQEIRILKERLAVAEASIETERAERNSLNEALDALEKNYIDTMEETIALQKELDAALKKNAELVENHEFPIFKMVR